jgi:site-specific DNA recombinase
MIKAALYLRSSKDRADASPAAQRRALHELAQSRKILIVDEYVDAAESGKDDNRPGFQSLLRDMRNKDRGWTHILVVDTARISRRRALAILFEEQECKKSGVSIIYRSLPESDPTTEMLLKSILQAMDEWHSLTSKSKGLAGMQENVRQGWRAGGRAPRGYRLDHIATGAIRDGASVTKSKLVTSDEAPAVTAYLRHRARGVVRSRAMTLAEVDWPTTTAIEIERNAMLYAGHTTWNRTEERASTGYVNGRKLRSRSEWVVKRDTHEPLISDDEAEAILAGLEVRKRSGGKPANRTYLLSSILFDSSGKPWNGDSGAYRLGRGVRISAKSIESAVLDRVLTDLQTDRMVDEISDHFQRMLKEHSKADHPDLSGRKIAEIDRKIGKLTELLLQTSTPEPLLRALEGFEAKRKAAMDSAELRKSEKVAALSIAKISRSQIRGMLRELAQEMSGGDAAALRDTLRQIIDRIEFSPESFEATLHYRISSGRMAGEQLASPRGFEPRSAP